MSTSLESLTNSDSYCRPGVILFRLSEQLKRRAAEIDAMMSPGESTPSLVSLLNQLPPDGLRFLARSGVFRSLFDRIHANPGKQASDSAIDSHTILLGILNRLAGSPRQSEEIYRSNGFDFDHTLVDPFPITVSALIKAGARSDEWSETACINEKFAAVLARHLQSQDSAYSLRPFEPFHLHQLAQALSILNNFGSWVLHDISINVRHICHIADAPLEIAELDLPNTVAGPLPQKETFAPTSCFYFQIPSCIFLSRKAFAHQPLLVESIYHESLHAKLLNTSVVFPIFLDGLLGNSGPVFDCPWRREASDKHRYWGFDRAFAAFHVYVHLAVLFNAITRREIISNIMSDWAYQRAPQCAERARILAGWIGRNIQVSMTDHGIKFFEHLASALPFPEEHRIHFSASSLSNI